jgi:hypothetical protein
LTGLPFAAEHKPDPIKQWPVFSNHFPIAASNKFKTTD